MKWTLALASLFSMAAADWTLYCGSTCGNDTSVVATGSSDLDGGSGVETCTSMNATYAYCYMQCEDLGLGGTFGAGYSCRDFWKVILSDGCAAASETEIFEDECTAAGSWNSYQVVANA